ncbi:hypothetical protein [Amycolatopsis sp. VC5-11]|uniref:hypothetical protein n=1 Tax=Amycolatopsis sp. VC5-11 TaxID=3120156 RepID=UPI00300AD588
MTLSYTEPSLVTAIATDPTCRPNPYVQDYGAKIPTARRLRYGRRWHRVYVMLWSNSGTAYILATGRRMILDPETELRFRYPEWTNREHGTRWWNGTCEGLFTLFDTSAHHHNGTPRVAPDDVQSHIAACNECQTNGLGVTDHHDGTATLDNL